MPDRQLLRRLISPSGLVLALLCFTFPFIAVSCEAPTGTIRADYTGWDLVGGGEPDVSGVGESEIGSEGESGDALSQDEEDDSIPAQPLAIMTLLIVLAGIGSTVVPRIGLVARAGVCAAAAFFLVVNQLVVRGGIIDELQESPDIPAGLAEDMVGSRFGFWLTLLLLLGVAGYNGAEVYLGRRAASPAPPPAWPYPPPGGPSVRPHVSPHGGPSVGPHGGPPTAPGGPPVAPGGPPEPGGALEPGGPPAAPGGSPPTPSP